MNVYLQQKTLYPPQIASRPSLNLGIIVVIPAYDEEFLLLSLMSLHRCTRPVCDVEVIVVVNGPENDPPEMLAKNVRIALQVEEWARKINNNRLRFHVLLFPDLPRKKAGVGLARKIGMDEACWRFEKIGKADGIIACFDADSRCAPNYLVALQEHFQAYPDTSACSIYFEHPLQGVDFEDDVYEAIAHYELHLRYFINAQKYAGFPQAYQTIGSSMAVRCEAYQKQGGMNRRQAGEDFYFLHKFTPHGRFTELNTTKVIPSPRPSHRVPFGTGKAVSELLRSRKSYTTYAPATFEALKAFFEVAPSIWSSEVNEDLFSSYPPVVKEFLSDIQAIDKIREIKKNTSSPETFVSRFYQWFNAFMVMKFAHFSRDHYYPDVPVDKAAKWLLEKKGMLSHDIPGSVKALLKIYRKLDRKGA